MVRLARRPEAMHPLPSPNWVVMNIPRLAFVPWARLLPALVFGLLIARAQESTAKSPQEILGATVTRLTSLIQPPTNTPAKTLSTTLRISEAKGLGKGLVGHTAQLAFQAPDRLKIATEVEGRDLQFGRAGQALWLFAPGKKFGVIGSPEVPRFQRQPTSVDASPLPPFRLPIPREQLLLLPLLLQLESLPAEAVGNARCHVLRAQPLPQAIEALKLPKGELRLWVRETDWLPARVGWTDDQGRSLTIELEQLQLSDPWPAEA